MGVVVLVVRVQGARAAHDLLVAAVAAGDVDAHGDRLGGLVGDHHALAPPPGALDRCVDRSQRLRGRRGGAALYGLGPFLQTTGTTAHGLAPPLGPALRVALLGGARRLGLAGVLGARLAAALLGRQLNLGLARLGLCLGERLGRGVLGLLGRIRGLLLGGVGLRGLGLRGLGLGGVCWSLLCLVVWLVSH